MKNFQFRLTEPPFLNHKESREKFPGFYETGYRDGNKSRAIGSLGTEDDF
jgi:hypothetical protein